MRLGSYKKNYICMEQEDLKWKQRAKRHWYKMVVRNMKLFHACPNQMKQKNHIKQVLDE